MADQFVSDAAGGGGGSGITGLTATRIPYAATATTLADTSALEWDTTNKRIKILGSGTFGALSWGNWCGISAQNSGTVYAVLRDTANAAEAFFGTSSAVIAVGSSTNHPLNLTQNSNTRLALTGTQVVVTTGQALALGNSASAAGVISSTSNATKGTITLGSTLQIVESLGNAILGAQSALATSATDGFCYMPTGAGIPTGTPTAYTGKVAFYYDTTNNKIYIYNGAWKSVTLA